MKQFNNRGMSLIELSVVAFTLGIIATGIMKYQAAARNTAKKVENKFEEIQLLARVQAVLAEKASCIKSLAGTVVGGSVVQMIKDNPSGSDITIVRSGLSYGEGASVIKIDRIRVGGSVSGAGYYTLPIVFRLTKPNLSPPITVDRQISIKANVDGANIIQDCFAEAGSSVEDLCNIARGSFDGMNCHYPDYIHDFDSSVVGSDIVSSTKFVRDAFNLQSPKYDAKYLDKAGDTMTGLLTANAGVQTTITSADSFTAGTATFSNAADPVNSIFAATSATISNGSLFSTKGLTVDFDTINGFGGIFRSSFYSPSIRATTLVDAHVATSSIAEAPVIEAGTTLTLGGDNVATIPWVTARLFENLPEATREEIIRKIAVDTTDQSGVNALITHTLDKLHVSKSFFSGAPKKTMTCIPGYFIATMRIDSTGYLRSTCSPSPDLTIEKDATCAPVTITNSKGSTTIKPHVRELRVVGDVIRYYCNPAFTVDMGKCDYNRGDYPVQDVTYDPYYNKLTLDCGIKDLYTAAHTNIDCIDAGGVEDQVRDPVDSSKLIDVCYFSGRSTCPSGWTARFYDNIGKVCNGAEKTSFLAAPSIWSPCLGATSCGASVGVVDYVTTCTYYNETTYWEGPNRFCGALQAVTCYSNVSRVWCY